MRSFKHLWDEYKLTEDQFYDLLEEQDNRCAICKEEKRLIVDHDHISKEVRGLLCYSCNTALGIFKEDMYTLLSAVDYIMRNDDFTNTHR